MTIERCPEPVNFKELFKYIPGESAPQKRTYKGKTIFLVDKFPVKNKENLKFNIESTNSRYRQGFGIKIFNGYLVIDGEPMEYEKRCTALFWEEFKDSEVQVFTKKAHIYLENIWEETIYEEHKSGHFQKADGSFTHSKIVKYPEGKK